MSNKEEFEKLLADAVRKEEAGEKIDVEVVKKLFAETRQRIGALEDKALRRLALRRLPKDAPEEEITAKMEEINKEFETIQKTDEFDGLDHEQIFKKLSLLFGGGEGSE